MVMGMGLEVVGLPGGLPAIDGGATGQSLSCCSFTLGCGEGAGCGGCGAGLFFVGAGCTGDSEGRMSGGGTEGLTRDGTGGGGVLETLGRLTSEETTEWEEPDSREVVLVEREGAGDGGREDTLDGTPGSGRRVLRCFSGGGGLIGATRRG